MAHLGQMFCTFSGQCNAWLCRNAGNDPRGPLYPCFCVWLRWQELVQQAPNGLLDFFVIRILHVKDFFSYVFKNRNTPIFHSLQMDFSFSKMPVFLFKRYLPRLTYLRIKFVFGWKMAIKCYWVGFFVCFSSFWWDFLQLNVKNNLDSAL